ncbi:MAG: hypothetical protein V4508_08920 [Pseudomonadota bacterium]
MGTVKQRQQYALIDRADCDWGQLHLHRLIDKQTGTDIFELVIHENEAFPMVVVAINADVVGAAISSNASPVFSALESSPVGLAAVALRVLGVKQILEALELAKVTIIKPAKKKPAIPVKPKGLRI